MAKSPGNAALNSNKNTTKIKKPDPSFEGSGSLLNPGNVLLSHTRHVKYHQRWRA